jgi:hypothetical protein
LLAALMLALSQLSWSGASRAEDEPGGEVALPVVRVLLAGDQARTSRLSEALLDPFRRARIELRFERVPHVEAASLLEPPALDDVSAAVLVFDLSRSNRAVLYLTDRGRSRVFVRELELSESLDEVTLERLVIAARTSVSAILAGESIGLARQDYERSLRAPRPAIAQRPKAKPHRAVSVASRYEARWLSGAVPSHGPGLMLAWSGDRIGLGVTVGGQLPWRYEQGDIGLRLVTFNTVVAVDVRKVLLEGWLATASLGLGLDATLVQPLALSARVTGAADASWAFDPFTRGQLGLSHTWTGFWLGAFGGLDLEFVRARYTIDRDGQRETLLSPQVLRPLLALGFGTIW